MDDEEYKVLVRALLAYDTSLDPKEGPVVSRLLDKLQDWGNL